MFRSILVPLDGSALAIWAVPAAIGVARRNAARIELVLVDDVVSRLNAAAGDTFASYLDDVARRIALVTDIPVKKTITPIRGRVTETLLQHAREAGSDLIVMTTHGFGPLKRVWLGSVADTVIREGRVPTLVIRPPDEGEPDLAHHPGFRHVLVPLDGSNVAETVFNYALGVAEPGVKVTLLRSVEPVPMPMLTPEYVVATPVLPDPEVLRIQKTQASEYLETVARSLRQRTQGVDTLVTVHASTSAAILDCATDVAADLIAITTHGHGGATRLLLGSIADKVVRGASVPVLVYRPT